MIVITAPTSNIGRQVVEALLGGGQPLRVIARDASRLPARVREHADVVEGSHGDAEVIERALDGATAVFWLAPPSPAAASLKAAYLDFTEPACRAFARRGVERVVGVSALGRGTPQAAHAGLVTASLAMDDMIAASGVAYRALAMPSFMDNMLRHVPEIRATGALSSPLAADRKHPTCATRDIASAAARLLLDASWAGSAEVPVLGPEDLSGDDMAEIMSEVLETPVRCRQISYEALRSGLAARGASDAFVGGYVDMMRAKDEGLDHGVPRTAESASPTSFRQWCEEVLKPAFSAESL